MSAVVRFFCCLILAVVLVVMLGILITITTLMVVVATGKTRPGLLAMMLPFSLTLALAPAVFVGCLTTGDSSRIRFLASIKSILIVAVFSVGWQLAIGPALGQAFFSGSDEAIQIAFAVDGFVMNMFLFLSAFLAAHWLPSLKPKATGPPPTAIKRFELLMFLCLAIFLIGAVVNYKAVLDKAAEVAAGTILEGAMGGPFIISTFASTFLITVFMTLRISRAGSKIMRLVMLCCYILSLVTSVPRLAGQFRTSPYSLAIAIVSTLIQGYALYLLYTDEANDWFNGKSYTSVRNAM